MTQPTYHDRRLGWAAYPTPEENRAFGQWVFLQVVAQRYPAVLNDLAVIAGAMRAMRTQDGALYDETAALDAWTTRWHLGDDWCRAHAVATVFAFLRYARSPRVWYDHDTARWDDPGALPSPHTRPLRHGQHFVWLARWQVGRDGLHRIAEGSADNREPTATVQTIYGACQSLAHVIGLTLTPRPPGRPRR